MTIVKSPETEEEFEAYYNLRWRILREPLKTERGTERDEFDESAVHAAAFSSDGIIGVGRGHFLSENIAQIRYMAVLPEYRCIGIGGMILDFLESELSRAGAREIVLNARLTALSFYTKAGYDTGKRLNLLGIQHYKMKKQLKLRR